MAKTLFDKIWDAHIVQTLQNGPTQIYIDRHYIHEVTSPQAFDGLRVRNIDLFRANQTFATCDHNIPTIGQDKPIQDESCRVPIDTISQNCKEYGITYFPMRDPAHGIVHVIGPEQGITLPGMTIVCGDSHTATHGAFGSIAFGIGTSEVEMVFATQSLLQTKPKQMRITVDGKLGYRVSAKDVILYIISKLGTSGGTGYFIEYVGEVFRDMSMEGRMTVCNMSIEMGARGGMVAPDSTTFDYIKGRRYAPKEAQFRNSVEQWSSLYSDSEASFDADFIFDGGDIEPMITYGTHPGMAIPIGETIPCGGETEEKALKYMGYKEGESMVGKEVDYIFLGSCTNGRIEDFRAFANFVEGKQKAENVIVWLVPGSVEVERAIEKEGIGDTLRKAGFSLREPGCSACLAMNDDKIPPYKYALSTSNRNFEGRQGADARTILCGPIVAAAAAISGKIIDPRTL